MKKIFLSALAAFFLLNIGFTAFAQETNDVMLGSFTKVSPAVIFSKTNEPKAVAGPIDRDLVHEKVLDEFNRFFLTVDNTEWYALDKKYKFYIVYFKHNGNNSKAVFSRKTGLQYAISYIAEKQLPAENRRVLKSNYVDYAFNTIMEISAEGQTFWLVILKNGEHTVIAKVKNGTIDELQHLVNSQQKK